MEGLRVDTIESIQEFIRDGVWLSAALEGTLKSSTPICKSIEEIYKAAAAINEDLRTQGVNRRISAFDVLTHFRAPKSFLSFLDEDRKVTNIDNKMALQHARLAIKATRQAQNILNSFSYTPLPSCVLTNISLSSML